MSDGAFARRFYSDRAELLASGCHFLPAGRVHGRAVHAPVGAVLPAAARAVRRGVGRHSERVSTCSRAVRVRRAAPPGAAKPGARPARPSPRRRPTRRCGWRCATPLLPEMPGPPGEAGSRDLQAARSGSSTGRSRATRSRSGPSTPTRCSWNPAVSGTWSAATSTGRTSARSVSRASAATSALPRRERDFRVPPTSTWTAPVTPAAGQRHPRRGEGRGRRRHRLVAGADMQRARTARGRRLRDPVLGAGPTRGLDPAPDGRAARAARAAPGGAGCLDRVRRAHETRWSRPGSCPGQRGRCAGRPSGGAGGA